MERARFNRRLNLGSSLRPAGPIDGSGGGLPLSLWILASAAAGRLLASNSASAAALDVVELCPGRPCSDEPVLSDAFWFAFGSHSASRLGSAQERCFAAEASWPCSQPPCFFFLLVRSPLRRSSTPSLSLSR